MDIPKGEERAKVLKTYLKKLMAENFSNMDKETNI